MSEKSSIKVGSRVKVIFKTNQNRDQLTKEFKGEIYHMPNKNQLNLIGYITENPTKLVTITLMDTDVVSISRTRLPKYFSDLLTMYVSKQRKLDKAKEDMSRLQDKQLLYDKDLQNIVDTLPREYAENEKGPVSSKTLTHLIYNDFKQIAKTDILFLESSQTILLQFILGYNLFGHARLHTKRDLDGYTYMLDYTQDDVLNYLWYKDSVINDKITVGVLDKYFDVNHKFKAVSRKKRDGTFTLEYYLEFKLKSSVDLKDTPEIIEGLKYLDGIIQEVKESL